MFYKCQQNQAMNTQNSDGHEYRNNIDTRLHGHTVVIYSPFKTSNLKMNYK